MAATNQTGGSEVSAEVVSATPQADGPLPAGWSHVDLGSCSAAGGAAYANVGHNTFFVSGSGSGLGVGSDPDGLSFLYEKVSGDFTFTARRVAGNFRGGKHQRYGIMIRESLDPLARSVAMIVGDLGAREARFGARAVGDGTTNWQSGNGYSHGITWLRLVRTSSTFTGYQSNDGKTWFAVGTPYTVPMASDIYAGFATSSNGNEVSDARYDNVSIDAAGR